MILLRRSYRWAANRSVAPTALDAPDGPLLAPTGPLSDVERTLIPECANVRPHQHSPVEPDPSPRGRIIRSWS